MYNIIMDCIDGIYILNCGSLCMVFTQDPDVASRVGYNYLGYKVNPFWRYEPIRPDEYDIDAIKNEIQNRLGPGGLGEFTKEHYGVFYVCGFALF